MDQLLLLFVPAVANLVLVEDVVLGVIDLVEDETGHLIDAGELIDVEVIEAVAFCVEFRAIAHRVLQAVIVGDVGFRELQDDVLHPGGIHAEIPVEIAFLDDVHVKAQLDTVVADGTDVLGGSGCHAAAGDTTDRRRVLHIEEQILRGLVEVLGGEVHPVEQAAFEGRAEGVLTLPHQVGCFVLRLVGGSTSTVLRAKAVEGHIAIISGAAVVTDLAIGNTVAEVVDPAYVLHEFLAADGPGGAHTPEVTPAVVLVEAGSTVSAEGTFEEVFAHIVIFHTRQVVFQAVAALGALH